MTPPPSAAVLPLHLTIRFSTSIPDLDLDISSPQATTVLSLKHLLRTRLSTRNRLRLIHQGRILPDPSALSSVLKSPPPPPPSSAADDAKGKGKAVDGNGAPVRVYVNCSIGDELSSRDLADEQAAAQNPPEAPSGDQASRPAGWTRPRPRGFDRLLQAGFTSSEISTLRTQFASIHTERFTPDATPSPDTLRALEDGWIDSNAGELPSSAANPLEDDLGNMSTVLDILIRRMMIGFFFPPGSLTWLLRQGVWSEKWHIFVGSGVVLSLTVGIVMGISGER
ncbi:DSC E3 ubiquitin ligase complex subunit 3 [Tolypocladium ophioglossoides CBS 100239]|uniref:DSC E3 ubiquitin ligase complex subunit 3 n=1 Tax=Tolypocladium ophioglossoides (strain CBS 100239) TaxID=1163406 RepID=A0A0L0NJV7_TOLOC|nr:DSC E3 ubiquitin ligase complex subunit 3 [Tolypocladium ophioglossoides CBS 100239]